MILVLLDARLDSVRLNLVGLKFSVTQALWDSQHGIRLSSQFYVDTFFMYVEISVYLVLETYRIFRLVGNIRTVIYELRSSNHIHFNINGLQEIKKKIFQDKNT